MVVSAVREESIVIAPKPRIMSLPVPPLIGRSASEPPHDKTKKEKKKRDGRRHALSKAFSLGIMGGRKRGKTSSAMPSCNEAERVESSASSSEVNGSVSPISKRQHMSQKKITHRYAPKITARYPLKDHEDRRLNDMLATFCFAALPERIEPAEYRLPKTHYFILTDEAGSRLYGTCLTIWEECDGATSRRNSSLQGR